MTSKKVFGDKMTMILDNAPYHHGYDRDAKVPETNNKYNTGRLRKHGAPRIIVKRGDPGGRGGKEECEFNFEVPPQGGGVNIK